MTYQLRNTIRMIAATIAFSLLACLAFWAVGVTIADADHLPPCGQVDLSNWHPGDDPICHAEDDPGWVDSTPEAPITPAPTPAAPVQGSPAVTG